MPDGFKEVQEIPSDSDAKLITDDYADAISYIVRDGNHLKADVTLAMIHTRKVMKDCIKRVAENSTDPKLKWEAQRLINLLENLA